MMEPLKASVMYEDLRSKADVDFSRRQNSYHHAIVVSVGLQLNSTLLRLNLDCNEIGDSGAAAIAEALKVNSSLQKLDLYYIQIGVSGAVAIARRHSTVRHLDLRYNGIGIDGATAFEQSLERSFLQLERKEILLDKRKEILLDDLTLKYRFLYGLSETGFRAFVMNDVSPALWPLALAKVSTCPSLIFHLWLQIFWC
jgi:hypothetical protein